MSKVYCMARRKEWETDWEVCTDWERGGGQSAVRLVAQRGDASGARFILKELFHDDLRPDDADEERRADRFPFQLSEDAAADPGVRASHAGGPEFEFRTAAWPEPPHCVAAGLFDPGLNPAEGIKDRPVSGGGLRPCPQPLDPGIR
jgi:hypothetical protein